MSAPDLPEALLGAPGPILADARPVDLLYFVLSVGDGDCQLLLAPEHAAGKRRVIVVDVASSAKMFALLDALVALGVLGGDAALDLVVATHPHDDHIGGMATLLRKYAGRVTEFWDPGYWHTTGGYHSMMQAIEDDEAIRYVQPSSGTSVWLGNVRVTALAPGISLRSRFDSYGIELNDSSIAMKLDFPASRVVQRDKDRAYIKPESEQSLVLGADAQTLSWAQVMVDFPQLGPTQTAVTKALQMANGTAELKAAVLKVPHHASKHGVNLELMEQIGPSVSVVSCGRQLGKYNFPHAVAQEIMREAIEKVASDPTLVRSPDEKLGIHYTGSNLDSGKPAGSVGLILRPEGTRRLYRFCEPSDSPIDLGAARRVG
jgi:beta-lactamase superfamily II metal-dependent hydrolase